MKIAVPISLAFSAVTFSDVGMPSQGDIRAAIVRVAPLDWRNGGGEEPRFADQVYPVAGLDHANLFALQSRDEIGTLARALLKVIPPDIPVQLDQLPRDRQAQSEPERRTCR